MRALIYKKPGEVIVAEVSQPSIVDSTDAIVRVTLAGICGTDLHVVRGNFPGIEPGAVIGHEFVGEVTDVGHSVRRIRRGNKVMSSDFTACGYCGWCDQGDHWHCRERAFFGTGTSFGPALIGAQAEFVRVPHADTTLGVLPPGFSEEAALLMGDNLATGWVAVERSGAEPGDSVVIIGGGAIGQLAALSAQAVGVGAVAVVEPNAQRQAFAVAHGSIAVHPDSAEAMVRQVTDGAGADVVLEAVGGNGPLDLATKLLRPRGRLVSVGLHVAEQWALPVSRAFSDELSVTFAIGDAIRVRRQLTRLVGGGAFDPTVVIDLRGPLSAGPAFYRDLSAQKCMKAIIYPQQ